MEFVARHLFAAWVGILAGLVSGALMGLFFHKETWLGGYGSFPRRMVRLGHISFFGLAMLNVIAAVTAQFLPLKSGPLAWASILLIVGAISMPAICFLTAWIKPARHMFFIPVASLILGALALLVAWP